MKWIQRLFKEEDGAVVVIVALALVILLGCMALVVDAGVMYVNRSNMQNVADAAALAGAQAISKGENPEALALEYAGKNGMKATVNGVTNDGDTVTVTTPYNGDSSKIFVKCTRNVPYLFAKALGFEDADVGAKAVARVTNPGGAAFDYAVFAGEGVVSMTGGSHIIGGSIYGKEGIKFTGSGNGISGNVDYYIGSPLKVDADVEGKINKLESPIPMPDFSELIKEQGITMSEAELNDAILKGKTIDGPIYVNGAITINGTIKGTGIICASGNITFGDDFKADDDNSILFYSANGSITINGGIKKPAMGIVYAPNGTITVNGESEIVYGRLIAKEITVNGNGLDVIASSEDLKSLESFGMIALIE